MRTACSPDATAPGQTRLSARRGNAKKNAAPYRRAHETSPDSRPTKQERRRYGRHPLLAPDRRRPLLFTRTACCIIFRSSFGAVKRRICCPLCLAVPAAFICHLLFALRPYASHRFSEASENLPKTHDRTESAIDNSGAAPSRRAQGISLKNQRSQDMTNPGRGFVRHRNPDAHCFSRALLVALFCTAFVWSRRLESVVRLASSTVGNLIGRIFQGFGLKRALQ